ncbi:MAG: AmmeMemoRadiSam system protein B [Nitrospiraceae bacterium]|nr:AmmeMemoRadiSam system protein B [Nitrospiraceae bacterium]
MKARQPAVAHRFYSGDPDTLRRDVEQYMDQADVEPAPDVVAAVVAPHAGFVYSGPTAGFAYGRVRGGAPGRVIVLGASHRYAVESASVYDSGAFDTPLGSFPIDEPFAQELAKATGSATVAPHETEHSIEVQLPFLAVAVGNVPIVPVLFGSPARRWHAEVGRNLAEMVDEGDLVVASTDLSHYLPQEGAEELDKRTVAAVLAQDVGVLLRGLDKGSCSMCGAPAVVAAMAYSQARGAGSWRLLDYRTSASTSGDYGQVVGYAAIAMEHAEDEGVAEALAS